MLIAFTAFGLSICLSDSDGVGRVDRPVEVIWSRQTTEY